MPVRTHTFRGRRKFKIRIADLDKDDGLCEWDTRTITLHENIGGKRELETLIHEHDHAQNPKKSELAVTRDARSLARLLWRWGYRKLDSRAMECI